MKKNKNNKRNTPGTRGWSGSATERWPFRKNARKSVFFHKKIKIIWQIGPGSMWQIGPGTMWQIGPGSMWQIKAKGVGKKEKKKEEKSR